MLWRHASGVFMMTNPGNSVQTTGICKEHGTVIGLEWMDAGHTLGNDPHAHPVSVIAPRTRRRRHARERGSVNIALQSDPKLISGFQSRIRTGWLVDVIIIGAGVIGCSLAYELASRGVAVTVVSASEAGEETTAASFAWVNANDKQPDSYARLNHLGIEQHEVWSSTLSNTGWFHQTGNIELIGQPDNLGRAQEKIERHKARDYDAEMLSTGDVRDMEPDMAVSGVVGAAWFPREGWVDTHRMCTELLALARQLGAQFHPFKTVTSIDNNGVCAHDRAGSAYRFSGDVYLLTAGNGIRKLVRAKALEFPVLEADTNGGGKSIPNPTLGVTCTTTPTEIRLNHMVTADNVALRPSRSEGVMLTDLATGSDSPRSRLELWELPEALLDNARSLYPGLDTSQLRTVCLGTRVLPSDGLSIIDWLSRAQNLYVIATHSGVTLAPYIAKAVADEIIDGRRAETLNSFDLARFA